MTQNLSRMVTLTRTSHHRGCGTPEASINEAGNPTLIWTGGEVTITGILLNGVYLTVNRPNRNRSVAHLTTQTDEEVLDFVSMFLTKAR